VKLPVLIGLLSLTIAPVGYASAATTFHFQFDDSGGGPDGTVTPPIVGEGTFVSPVDLAPGTYDLSSLTGFSMDFSFPSTTTFSTADIVTPVDEVAITITQFAPAVERLIFTESGPPPCCDGGPLSGSLDLVNPSGFGLSFEPTAFGGNNLYVALDPIGNELDFGNYLALSRTNSVVPELPTWAMMLLGLAGLGVAGVAPRPRA
jgi:hypothetical protein